MTVATRERISSPPRLGPAGEDFLAELTDAAYRVALRHQLQAPFVDVQLDIWAALRDVLVKELAGRCPC